MTNHLIHIAARGFSDAGPWSLRFGAYVLLGCWCLALLAVVPANAQYAIDWFTIDGGGGVSGGGNYSLSGTIGQPDAGAMTGGGYTLEGGFWPGVVVPSIGEAPTLFIQLSGVSVFVSWSPATPGFSLEQSSTLLPLSWGAAPGAGTNPVVIPLSTGTRFYRLRKP
jgi:hypothetical protein